MRHTATDCPIPVPRSDWGTLLPAGSVPACSGPSPVTPFPVSQAQSRKLYRRGPSRGVGQMQSLCVLSKVQKPDWPPARARGLGARVLQTARVPSLQQECLSLRPSRRGEEGRLGSNARDTDVSLRSHLGGGRSASSEAPAEPAGQGFGCGFVIPWPWTRARFLHVQSGRSSGGCPFLASW